jgi:hypothetical protein
MTNVAIEVENLGKRTPATGLRAVRCLRSRLREPDPDEIGSNGGVSNE